LRQKLTHKIDSSATFITSTITTITLSNSSSSNTLISLEAGFRRTANM
jgi:hypothetical protein